MTKQITLSKSGKNVLTETNPNQLIFQSTHNAFKIIRSGSFSKSIVAGTTTESVIHNLGKKHGFYAFMFSNTINGFLPMRAVRLTGLTTDGSGAITAVNNNRSFDAYCTNTTLEFSIESADSDTVIVKWFIFDNHI